MSNPRVDRRQYIGHCTQDQAAAMYLNFYPEASESDAEKFASETLRLGRNNLKISPATLQSLFLEHKEPEMLTDQALITFFDRELNDASFPQ